MCFLCRLSYLHHADLSALLVGQGQGGIFKGHVQCVVQEERVAYLGTGGGLLLASCSRVHTACLAGLASVVSSLGPSCTPASTRSMHDLWQRVERSPKVPWP
jgi:hypothetical protein